MSAPYQYGVQTVDGVVRYPRRTDAIETARAWVISPLRSGGRVAQLVRRRGWDEQWSVVATWTSPELRP
jgi:hypothetical protein